MDIENAFDELQKTVNVPDDDLKEARRRRDLFRQAFREEPDRTEDVVSGSLARGSHQDPIKDVDVIIVFDPVHHPGWGSLGDSAEEALEHVRGRVTALLGVGSGTVAQEVRLTLIRNHSVKCFFDDPDDPSPFTVDVVPALRTSDGILLVPEKESRLWIRTNPEELIRLVADRHANWNQFVKLVRCVKRWAADDGTEMKGLLLEVIALDHLSEDSRDRSLARFFTAAGLAVLDPVEDPAGECGEIQPDLDRQAASASLHGAAEHAWRAVEARERGETDEAACHWRKVFGDIFPEPASGCDQGQAAAAGAAAAITVRPRPVRDNPQG